MRTVLSQDVQGLRMEGLREVLKEEEEGAIVAAAEVSGGEAGEGGDGDGEGGAMSVHEWGVGRFGGWWSGFIPLLYCTRAIDHVASSIFP